ncbi:rhodanese-related sulfurtransferase [Stappia sp. GBMRC 2046]|uniref:tRNA uridine(34) hydroxylase n=1 Tax=Stappia sediminis TaxID=2692190 RepID=A0A7X3LRA0_9HYPH|nr:rhodanese-related sulfurtransferase [Stappia sediminis]MXN63652.1 rhodanese-related sulfurtransferase [Stappia sediminis]
MPEIKIAALYKFVDLESHEALREPLLAFCRSRSIFGSLLLAREGINGTVAGSPEAIGELLEYLRSDERFAELDAKFSYAARNPFKRMKVRLKKEIVSLGVAAADPRRRVGTYIAPEDWNALVSDPDVVLVDTRNDYEVAFGRFQGAVDPGTRSFREFAEWVRQAKELEEKPRVAMYCTGGIRCEKATALLLSEGFEEVYHLKGGILNYLEKMPEAESLWSGSCFVFDERIAVDHDLAPTWGRDAPRDAFEILPSDVVDTATGSGNR